MKTKALRIGYQGEKGAYSETAIEAMFAEQKVEKKAFRTSYAVVDALKKNKIDFGLLPIENSIMGSITHTYDLLLENSLHISREVIIPIHHALLVTKGVKTKEIKKIYSHPAAIAQCEVFLRKFEKAEILPTYDTAGSARMIAEKKLGDAAAIAGAGTAEVYDLDVLYTNIEDYPHNQTRFVLVSIEKVEKETSAYIPCKVTAAFDALDQPGMLHQCLGIFEKYEVNLTQLASRPSKSEPWKYHFFVDLEGRQQDTNVREAFEEIGKLTGAVYLLGSYPKFELAADDYEPHRKKGIKKKTGPLYSLEAKPEPTIIEVKGHKIGGGNFTLIAGPCSVEGRE